MNEFNEFKSNYERMLIGIASETRLTGESDEFDLQQLAGDPRLSQLDVMLIPAVDVDRLALVPGVVAQVHWRHLLSTRATTWSFPPPNPTNNAIIQYIVIIS